MRHGHSLSAREAGVASDSERPLSQQGEKEALETSLHLKASGFTPDLIISSPFARADRTAAIAAEVFPGTLRKTEPSLSEGPLQALLELILHTFPEKSRVLVVGHQPLLGAAGGFMLGMDIFDLSPAGFIRLTFTKEPGAGSLTEFYIPPPSGEQSR